MKRYNTLASLDGLRVGVPLIASQMNAAELCAQQLTENTVGECLRSKNVSVAARIASIMLQGINITLVPLNDSSFGVWQAEEGTFSGILGHIGIDVDTTLESWSTLLITSITICLPLQRFSSVESSTYK